MKKALFAVLIILALIIGALVYIASQAGALIQKATLDYGPEVTGAAIELDGVDVSFLGGQARLNGLVVHNPEGFKSSHAFKVDEVAVRLDVMSVMDDVIRIQEIRIQGADLVYELGSKGNNIHQLQKNVENYIARFGAREDSESVKKFIIDDIYVNGTKVQLATDLMGGKSAGLTLPDIHLENVGNENKAATGAEVLKKVLSAVNTSLGKVVTKDMIKDALGEAENILKDIFK
ncbi:AsmA family protein [Luteithermobacter gelatinilyticus]|uniref:AsmA family protein n=1 Tax=Luteithermobacter gelatinilyticus TaxID=2582913 RepID=UPI001106CEEB|nr:AsmA family protein [Luteithermobacter gelatinilyticus]